MRKKITSCFALFAMAATLFAACNSNQNNAAPTTEPTVTAAPTITPEPTATPEPTKKPTATPLPFDKNVTLMNTYGTLFDYSGVCIAEANDLENVYTVKLIKKHYNSVTLENEMKPDGILKGVATLISVEEAKTLGYVIPDNYTETTVPKLELTNVDLAIKLCTENELGFRAHTLVWHSQTPDWFFRTGYTSDGEYVTPEVMDARMEFYIRTMMGHVYDSEYGACVYAWDVVNEYPHAVNSGWEKVYGNQGNTPSFVKLAYRIADDVLNQYGIRDKVTLVFNDYNTYQVANQILSILDFVNEEETLCDTIGMQAHLDTKYPSTDLFKNTLQQFLDAGYEVQITELDVTCTNDTTQANYYYNLMKGILEIKKEYENFTGITYWGVGDDHSWRGEQNPLLFSMLGIAKPAYYKVLQAYEDCGFEIPQ